MKIAAVLLAATCAQVANGHVKVFYTPTQMSVRNAGGETGDGGFSVSGPCGGANTFGANGVNEAQDGQELCVRINYNGGHKSDQNRFRTVFQCGGVGPQGTFENLQTLPLKVKEGVTSPIEAAGDTIAAPQGNDIREGYTACVDLPAQGLTDAVADDSPQRQCTLSIMDQRDWGGCIDMKLANKPAEPEPTPPPTPITPKSFDPSWSGLYEIKTCDFESGGKCCAKGYIGLSKSGGVIAELSGVSHEEFKTGVADADSQLCAEYENKITATLQWEGDVAGTFTNRVEFTPKSVSATPGGGQQTSSATPQTYQILARDPKPNGVYLFNEDPDLPITSDGVAQYVMSLEDGIAQGLISSPPPEGSGTTVVGEKDDGSGDGSSLPIIIGASVAGVLAVGAFAVNRRRQAANQNPNYFGGPQSTVAATYSGYDAERGGMGYGGQYPQQQGGNGYYSQQQQPRMPY